MDYSKMIANAFVIVLLMSCVAKTVDAWTITCDGAEIATGDSPDIVGFEAQWNYCSVVEGSLGFHTESDAEADAIKAKIEAAGGGRMSRTDIEAAMTELCTLNGLSCSFPRTSSNPRGTSVRDATASARRGDGGPSIVVGSECTPSPEACAMKAFSSVGVDDPAEFVQDLFEGDGERGLTSHRLATTLAPTFAPTTAAPTTG